MPGGFHPFHAGHAALYQSAVKAFPNAEVYVAATNDTKTRPFPFSIKEKLAKLAGVASGHFIQVKSPFKSEEITSHYNSNEDVLIFVRSEKDRTEQPKPGGTKKDGTPAYFQPWTGENLQPFSKHAYIAYLPTVEFGPGIKSATEIRNAWPKLDDRRKTAMVMSLYPVTQTNPKLAANVVKMLDIGMGEQQGVAENDLDRFKKYTRPVVKTTPKIEKTTNPAGRTTDHIEWKVTTPTGEIYRYKSKKQAQEHFDSFGQQGVAEARTNPEQNRRSGSGKYDLINYAEDNINDKDNWAVSMTMEPKLGINPRAAVSEDTPKGIYFYPLRYFMKMADRDESLPWGDNFPYIQLFQYDRSGEMTKETKVDPAKLKQALSQYCSDEVIQQASEEGDYDGTPYWFIYDCLSRLGKGDETNVIRWNKVLRDLGFTSVYDDGGGWIAYNEPTQGVVLDPRIIKQHNMFSNRNPTLQHRRYDIQGLADAIGWSSYFQRESQLQRIYNHPDEKKVMLDVAKSMLKPFLGKSSEEADEMGYDQALKAAADKVIEILKSQNVKEGAPIVVAQAPIHIRNPKKAQPVQRYMGDIVPPTQPPSTEKRGVKGRPGQRPMPTYESANLSVEQLAHISDKALDDAYHYGRSTPGANFGWMANLQSAKAAKKLIDAGETDIETISDAIHKGWNITAAADYKGQLQLDTPTPEDKKLKRAKLAMQSYSQLPEEEKEKDRVVARAMLAALGKTNVSESADYLEEK